MPNLRDDFLAVLSPSSETVEVPVTLRKQRAIVEREAPDGSTTNEETGPETDNLIPR